MVAVFVPGGASETVAETEIVAGAIPLGGETRIQPGISATLNVAGAFDVI